MALSNASQGCWRFDPVSQKKWGSESASRTCRTFTPRQPPTSRTARPSFGNGTRQRFGYPLTAGRSAKQAGRRNARPGACRFGSSIVLATKDRLQNGMRSRHARLLRIDARLLRGLLLRTRADGHLTFARSAPQVKPFGGRLAPWPLRLQMATGAGARSLHRRRKNGWPPKRSPCVHALLA